jgi:hypothetical protein
MDASRGPGGYLPPAMISRATEEAIKVWLCLGGVGLIGAWRHLPKRVAVGILAVLITASAANYARFGTELLLTRIDTYDVMHYYLNAKYFPELGYYDLYPACIQADHENDGPRYGDPTMYMAQDDTGDHLRPIEQAYARGRVVKEHFTPERWAAFSHDFVVLQRQYRGMDRDLWAQMVQDHGYNGTTVWTAIARPLVSVVPVEKVKWLASVDVVLLLGALACVVWAYDAPTALWTALFLLLTYSTRWPTISWAILRYDYVAALLVAVCLLKKGRPLLAGAFTGYAATLRLFPALWMTFCGTKGAWELVVERKVNRPLAVLLGGFLLGLALFQGFAAASVGVDAIRIHYENMSQHNASDELSSRRIGLALGLNYRGQVEPKNITKAMKGEVESQRHLRYGIGIAATLALGWALRRSPDEEAFAYGFVPLFLFTTASYYYYVVRVTLITVNAADLRDNRRAVGLAGLFLIEALTNAIETQWPEHRVMLIGWLAWALCAWIAGMGVWLGLESRRETPAPTDPAATA